MSVYDTQQSTSTTLPSWFTDAQKQVGKDATAAYGATIAPSETVGADLATSLSGKTNPFTTSMGTLQQIASGAANPWLDTGAPDITTTLGGLFNAQNQQLNQVLPGITAQEGATGIGSGNFGSLRGQTAVNTARAGALANLNTTQNKAALDALTQGIQAGQGVGNVGAQYGTSALNTANWQQLGALPALAKYSDIINQPGSVTDKNVTQITSPSEYTMAANTLGALFGTGGANQSTIDAITKAAGGGLSWLKNIIAPTDNSLLTNAGS
jgi:hypothetical protein